MKYLNFYKEMPVFHIFHFRITNNVFKYQALILIIDYFIFIVSQIIANKKSWNLFHIINEIPKQ